MRRSTSSRRAQPRVDRQRRPRPNAGSRLEDRDHPVGLLEGDHLDLGEAAVPLAHHDAVQQLERARRYSAAIACVPAARPLPPRVARARRSPAPGRAATAAPRAAASAPPRTASTARSSSPICSRRWAAMRSRRGSPSCSSTMSVSTRTARARWPAAGRSRRSRGRRPGCARARGARPETRAYASAGPAARSARRYGVSGSHGLITIVASLAPAACPLRRPCASALALRSAASGRAATGSDVSAVAPWPAAPQPWRAAARSLAWTPPATPPTTPPRTPPSTPPATPPSDAHVLGALRPRAGPAAASRRRRTSRGNSRRHHARRASHIATTRSSLPCRFCRDAPARSRPSAAGRRRAAAGGSAAARSGARRTARGVSSTSSDVPGRHDARSARPRASSSSWCRSGKTASSATRCSAHSARHQPAGGRLAPPQHERARLARRADAEAERDRRPPPPSSRPVSVKRSRTAAGPEGESRRAARGRTRREAARRPARRSPPRPPPPSSAADSGRRRRSLRAMWSSSAWFARASPFSDVDRRARPAAARRRDSRGRRSRAARSRGPRGSAARRDACRRRRARRAGTRRATSASPRADGEAPRRLGRVPEHDDVDLEVARAPQPALDRPQLPVARGALPAEARVPVEAHAPRPHRRRRRRRARGSRRSRSRPGRPRPSRASPPARGRAAGRSRGPARAGSREARVSAT